ncbi:hypothetical protein [Micromonospora sagamiensis]|uniref:Uncharacterized protein n=1 Tax=Micromonospora sagamiensis TaxID=47875 RepID=A0A562WKT6_9ACTN|nr:hypothetical protein [Micromonospora sagamiensis]TWJ30806.1 hypothetical protein JD81_04355 [Micromonospora sagamiensis]BCL16157.1 hypothetical protein GCM10017556_38960 [Micromonospora sagamiensis]
MAKMFSRKAVAVTLAVLGLSLAGGGIAVAQPNEGSGAQPAVRQGQQPPLSPESARKAQEALKQDAGTLATTVSFAVVRSNGVLARGQDVVSVTRYGVGQYEVLFNRVLSRGAYVATLGDSADCCVPANGEISVAPRLSITTGVFVQTRNSSGTAADRPFHLHVTG